MKGEDICLNAICIFILFALMVDITPKDIVKMAKEKNLDYIALTDHDTLTGIHEALSRSRSSKC